MDFRFYQERSIGMFVALKNYSQNPKIQSHEIINKRTSEDIEFMFELCSGSTMENGPKEWGTLSCKM